MSDRPERANFESTDDAEAARKFFKLWQKGTPTRSASEGAPPDLTQFVQNAGPLTPVQLAAVVCVDLRERWKHQQPVLPEDYLQRFPQLQAEAEAALDVVYCDFLLRDEQGEAPTAAEYAARFPQLAVELKRQIDMHRLLQVDEEEMASRRTVAQEDSSNTRNMLKPLARSTPGSKNWPKIPGFEILDRLGRGGMGVVYKAWQEKLFRVVALKMLQPDTGDPEQALARFRVEAEAIARLHHANILQVYEIGVHDDQPYLVLEFADGGTLAQKTDGTPWPAKDAAQMVETLARAVHYAHQRGVLHRDLTPGNVLLFADGTPKLSDFGLAKLLVGGSTLTQTGAVVGTPSYMSPEQASGSSHDAGPTVDVYALGAILFELLTGRPPFKAATPLETLAMVVHAEPVSPRQLQPSVPRDLETICIKCLRKEPTRRYAAAADLADDLRNFLSDHAIRARPVGLLERFWRWGRRNPGWAAALAMLLVVAVGAVGAALELGRLLHAERHLRHAEQHALQAEQQAKSDALHKLYHSTVNEARAERLKGWVGQRYHSLGLLDEAKKLADQLNLKPARFNELRDEVIACLALPDLQLLREWDGFPPATYGLDFDETMTFYARGDMQGKISVRRIEDDAETASIAGQGEPVQLRFSPDAAYLAVAAGSKLRLWQRNADRSFDMPASKSFSFGFQGRQLALLDVDGKSIVVVDVASRGQIHKSVPGETISRLAFHPVLPLLALAGDKEALLYDLTGQRIVERIPHPDQVICLAWAQNGRVLATGCADRNLRVFAVGTKAGDDDKDGAAVEGVRQLAKVLGHGVQGMEVMLNRDGTILAGTNWAGNLRLWEAHSGQPLFMPLAEAGHFRFAARDDLLACAAAGDKVRLYRTIAGREFRRLPDFNHFRRASMRQVVFQPAGRLLFAAADDGLVSIDTERIEVQALPLQGNWTIPLAFDKDGSLITEAAAKYLLWPAAKTASGRVRYGPPRALADARQGMREKEMRTAVGPGPMLAIPELDDGALLVWPAAKGGAAKSLHLAQKDVRCCALSADGRFVATSVHDAPNQPAAVIWDAKTGERLRDVPVLPRYCEVGFSPDSRWFVTTGGGCRLWDTANWRQNFVLGGNAFAFSADGKMLAVEGVKGQVVLVDPATGTEFASLTAPGELHSLPACFNHDGSLLAVYGSESQSMHVWDLRAVRARLREKNLDWTLPRLPAPVDGPTHVDMVQ